MHIHVSTARARGAELPTYIDCGHLNTLLGSRSVLVSCRRSKLDTVSATNAPAVRKRYDVLSPVVQPLPFRRGQAGVDVIRVHPDDR